MDPTCWKRKRSISESFDNPTPHVSPCLPPDDPVQKPVPDSVEDLWTDCLELTDQENDCTEEDLHLWADTDETHKLDEEFEFEPPPYNSYEELLYANYLAENWDEALQDDSDDNALEIYITPEMAKWHELCPREH